MERTEAEVVGCMTRTAEQTRNIRSYDQDGQKPRKMKSATGRMTNVAKKDKTKPAEWSDL